MLVLLLCDVSWMFWVLKVGQGHGPTLLNAKSLCGSPSRPNALLFHLFYSLVNAITYHARAYLWYRGCRPNDVMPACFNAGESVSVLKHTEEIPDPRAVNQDKKNTLFSVRITYLTYTSLLSHWLISNSAGWAIHISCQTAVCVCPSVCLDVNQGGTNRNRYTKRLIMLRS